MSTKTDTPTETNSRTAVYSFRIPEELIDGLDDLADDRGISRSEALRSLIEEAAA